MHYSSRRRARFSSAFTLVELLVVIAIIGVLVGLLLPAVQAAREAARRMQCSNNVKQISLSLHNYHDTHRAFPIGANDRAIVRRTPWMPSLLPYFEQTALYNQYVAAAQAILVTRPAALINHIDRNVRDSFISVLACPSDPQSPGNTRGFHGNYVALDGSAVGMADKTATGIMYRLSRVRFGDITDGTSNTVAFSEILVRPPTNRVGWGEPGAYWTGSSYGGTRFTTFEGPNTSVPDQFHTCNAHDYIYAPCISTGKGATIGHYARSLHTGGVQAGLCDGSVRFVSNSVDLVAWRSVGSRAGGEVVGGDW